MNQSELRSKYLSPAPSAGKRVHLKQVAIGFGFTSGFVENVARDF